MTSQEKELKSYLKLAQIHRCLGAGHGESAMIKQVLQKEGNINYKIPSNSCADSALIGNTALHFATIKNDIELFRVLLKNGADFAIQNQKGHTVLHSSYYLEKPNRKIIDNILAIHVEIEDPLNPTDEDGLSYFHIACIYNQLHVVEYFLKKGVSVGMAINSTSEKFPGYTPLHIATQGLFLSLVKLLLKYKANMNVKNAQGLTPLHILLKKKIDLLDEYYSSYQEGVPNYSITVVDNLMNLLVESNDVNDIGLTSFHIACTQPDLSDVEYISMLEQNVDLDLAVKMDSPIFPGYTALHFAAHCNFNIALMLLKKGANPQAKDANSVTPMDLFWNNQKPGNVQMLIQEYWDYVMFNDEETSLINFYKATSITQMLPELFLILPDITTTIGDIPEYWAGRTLLHFVVMFCKNILIIEYCLGAGLQVIVDAPDFHGVTPIHLAFRMNKLNFVDILMKNCVNSINFADNEGLTYLHIACSLDRSDYVEKFCKDDNFNMAYCGTSTYGFVTPGSTPLHVAMANGQNLIIYDLITTINKLERGLDFEAKNAKGETPLDLFLRLSDNIDPICNTLVSSARLTNSMLENVGLSKLHLAIYCDVKDIRPFITPENINLVINCHNSSSIWYQYNGYTPLHLGIKRYCSVSTVKVLLEKNADILLENQQGDMPLYTALTNKSTAFPAMDLIVQSLQSNQILRNKMKEQSGITILHIFCHVIKLDTVNWSLVEQGHIDARVKSECPIWPGCTPLHVLMKSLNKRREIDEHFQNILKMLLSSGADVTAEDSNGVTPIHLAIRNDSLTNICTVLAQLFGYLPVTPVNPVDRNGMSHFHVACLMNNVEKVTWFLENKLVDVNQPIDFFATKFAGERPLHLAVDHSIEKRFNLRNQRETVNLLLKHGADVKAEDNFGQTALHKAVLLENSLDTMESLLRHGADLDAHNVFGQTPLELMLKSEYYSMEMIKLVEKHGFSLNNCNPYTEEGYLSMLISRQYHINFLIKDENPSTPSPVTATAIVQVITDITNHIGSYVTDDMGRSVIHNIVTTSVPFDEVINYWDLIEKAKAANVDIDHQDKKGRTPLHLAAMYGNFQASKALLHGGADINILDSENKTAFEFAMEFYENKKFCPHKQCHRKVIMLMAGHVAKLHDLKLKVNQKNSEIQVLVASKFFFGPCHYEQTEMMEFQKNVQTMVIDEQSNLTLENFMTEMGKGLIAYPFMSDPKREQVDRFFRNYNGDLKDMCAVIYMKALRRVRLGKLVTNLFSAIAGSIVPNVCVEMIFQYLTNEDLENYIKATSKNC